MDDIYADQVQVTVGLYGTTLVFGRTEPEAPEAKGLHTQVVIRCSPSLAKILSLMLRRNVKTLESMVGQVIGIPTEEYRQVGVAEEDW